MARFAWTKSVILRFGALVFLFQLIGAALVLAIVHQLTQGELEATSRQLATELRDELVAGDLAANEANGNDQARGIAAARATIAARLADGRDRQEVILLVDARGRALAGNLAAWPPNVAAGNGWRVIDLFRLSSDQPERMGLIATALPGGARLLTGHVVETDLRFGGIMEEAMLSALLLALPLALLAAWLSARLIQSRVRGIVTTAQAIGTGEMELRVPIAASGDTFDQLAIAINAMLDRIMALMGELRLVTDGLAHDLRLPLTRLKAVLDRSLTDTDDPAAQAALGRALEESDILLAMLTTALLISRTEAGIGRDAFVTVDLTAMLGDLQEMYGPLADDHGVEILVEAVGPVMANVHRELIGQAIANLIDNALKYGGTRIVLGVARTDGRLLLSVADDGAGIAADMRDEALRRFGRLDAARHMSGAGLGLSLVAAVARLHGGTMVLEDNAPGLRVVIAMGDGDRTMAGSS